MLVVKPDPNNDKNDIKALNAYLDGEPCGCVRFRHKGYILVIDELLPLPENPKAMDRQIFGILDTIMRALGSYGLNHSCYYLECEDPMLFDTLCELRFYRADDIVKSDLSKILNHQHD